MERGEHGVSVGVVDWGVVVGVGVLVGGAGGGMKGGIVFDECSEGGEEGFWTRGA